VELVGPSSPAWCTRIEVNDLRQSLMASVSRIRRSLWRRKVQWLRVQLQDTRIVLKTFPQVVEPTADGRTMPKKGEFVWVILDDEGSIDRIWTGGGQNQRATWP